MSATPRDTTEAEALAALEAACLAGLIYTDYGEWKYRPSLGAAAVIAAGWISPTAAAARDAAHRAEALRGEWTESDLRDVGNWLVREADQRVKFFPQRVDEVDALMRHVASLLFTAALAERGAQC